MQTIKGETELQQLQGKLHELLNVLRQENDCLQSREIASLEKITREKQILLETLDNMQFSQADKDKLENETVIKQLLQDCEELNLQNGRHIQMGLRLNEQLLTMMCNPDMVSVYTADGKSHKSFSYHSAAKV